MLAMIRRILKISGEYKPKIILGIIFNFLKSVSMSCMLFAIYIVVNHLNSMNGTVIRNALFILIASVAGRFLFQYLMDISMSAKGYSMFRDYRLSIGERMRKAPMGYYSEKQLGSIQMVLTSTIMELEQYSMLAITDITGGVMMSTVIMVFFLFFEPVFALITLIGLVIGLTILHIILNVAKKHTPKVLAAQENMTVQSMEYIRGISVLRTFSKANDHEGAVFEAFDKKRTADLEQEYSSLPLLKIYAGVYKLTGCILLLVAVLLYISGKISIAYCLMFLVSAFIVYSEMEQMGDGAFLSRKITTELNRLEAVTKIPQIDRSEKELQLTNFDIELKDVGFGYDTRKILNHVSLKVPQRTTCAIVGPSGSGKTTLCNLIARFWDVTEGKVLVGGKDIKDYTAESLMKYISMVFQNVYLFNDTIENNIRFGNPDATKEQIIAAAKSAQCHEFISNLPEGYQTIVGEGGNTLSGGEKQRISIARAILKDAPIIILDEATSSVDPENEKELVDAIDALTKEKTIILIAHRLKTVRNADQIIVVDQGGIVQRGRHEQLMKEEGVYQRYINARELAVGWKL